MLGESKTVIWTTRNPANLTAARRGVSLLYMLLLMSVMCALASLGVDYGRVQLVKAQLRRSVDAAARAAAGGLGTSTAAAQSLALQYASMNLVDGTSLVLDPAQGDVQIGKWVVDATGKTAPYFQVLSGSARSGANAVRVVGHRSDDRGTAVPLIFGKAIGAQFCNVSAESIAMYIPPVSLSQTIQATANPFLSGMPAGSSASEINPSPRAQNVDHAGTASNPLQSPIVLGLPISSDQPLTFDAISGTARHDPNLSDYQPDGQLDDIGHNNLSTSSQNQYLANHTYYNENGIADMVAPIDALVGVFLDDNASDQSPTPTDNLDFSTSDSRDFTTLQPKLKQMFFIGDGLRNDGKTQQSFVPPKGATRLFLATWDFYEWNNNQGYRTVNITRAGKVITVK